MATDDRVLLSLKPVFLVAPAPGLPDGVQLRVRAAPEATAAEVGFLEMLRLFLLLLLLRLLLLVGVMLCCGCCWR